MTARRSISPTAITMQYGVAVRSAYELSPGIKPFVEVGSDRREHDQINCFCEDRDSDGRTIKGGLQFELTRKLIGEFSAGTLTRDYKDPALEDVARHADRRLADLLRDAAHHAEIRRQDHGRRIQHPGRVRHADARFHPAGAITASGAG